MVTFLEKILFWKKKKKTKYRFQSSPWDDSTWVEITHGKFQGVIYSYGYVRFMSEIEVGKLQFDYNVINSGKYSKEELKNNSDFVTIMGDILTEIIIENDPSRTNNPKKSNL